MMPWSGVSTSPVPVSTSVSLLVGDDHHRLEPAQIAVGAPVLGELDGGAHQLVGILLELGLEPLEQGEGVGGGAGKAADHLAAGEAPDLLGGVLHHGVADATPGRRRRSPPCCPCGPRRWSCRASRGNSLSFDIQHSKSDFSPYLRLDPGCKSDHAARIAANASLTRDAVRCGSKVAGLHRTLGTLQIAGHDRRSREAGMRTAEITRKTNETDISVSINLDGTGRHDIADRHRLSRPHARPAGQHSLIDMTVRAKGDLHIDFHHTAEDVGIALGEAVKQALGDKKGIRRYASADLPMDGTLTRVALDVSRPAVPRLEGRVHPRQGRRDGHRAVPRVVPGLRHECRHHAACRDASTATTTTTSPRALFKALARALRDCRRDRSARRRRHPVDQGHALGTPAPTPAWRARRDTDAHRQVQFPQGAQNALATSSERSRIDAAFRGPRCRATTADPLAVSRSCPRKILAGARRCLPPALGARRIGMWLDAASAGSPAAGADRRRRAFRSAARPRSWLYVLFAGWIGFAAARPAPRRPEARRLSVACGTRIAADRIARRARLARWSAPMSETVAIIDYGSGNLARPPRPSSARRAKPASRPTIVVTDDPDAGAPRRPHRAARRRRLRRLPRRARWPSPACARCSRSGSSAAACRSSASASACS